MWSSFSGQDGVDQGQDGVVQGRFGEVDLVDSMEVSSSRDGLEKLFS